jgi:hypothetical protein
MIDLVGSGFDALQQLANLYHPSTIYIREARLPRGAFTRKRAGLVNQDGGQAGFFLQTIDCELERSDLATFSPPRIKVLSGKIGKCVCRGIVLAESGLDGRATNETWQTETTMLREFSGRLRDLA